MTQVTFTREKNGTTEQIKFEEGQKFELNGITFRIVSVNAKGKMTIRPA